MAKKLSRSNLLDLLKKRSQTNPSYFNKRHSFDYLDGLRGIASLSVVFCHLLLWFYPAVITGLIVNAHNKHELALYRLPVNIFWNGNFAVCIFFVLSGFVLSYKFLATKDPDVLTSSAFRRYPRLMIPAFGSVMIGYACIRLHLFWNTQQAVLNKTPGSVLGFWSQTGGFLSALWQGLLGIFTEQLTFAQHFNGVLWTMYFEFIGSFIVFGTLALFRSVNTRKFAYILLAVVFAKTYFLGFVLGMVLADLHNSSYKMKVFQLDSLKAFAVPVAGILLGTYPQATTDAANYMVETHRLAVNGGGSTDIHAYRRRRFGYLQRA